LGPESRSFGSSRNWFIIVSFLLKMSSQELNMTRTENVDKNKEIMLECNKHYAILALNCILKNSKGKITVSEIKRRDRNNSMKEE